MREPRFSRRTKRGVGMALLAAVALGGLYYALVGRYHVTEIREGVYYHSPSMPPEVLQDAVQEHGIRTVIDFRFVSADTREEEAAMRAVGVAYHNLPTHQVPTEATVKAFLAILDEPKNFPVLAHCRHGIGRAALFAALYRIEHEGFTPDEARRAAKVFSFRGDFAPDGDKGSFLIRYQPRRLEPTPL